MVFDIEVISINGKMLSHYLAEQSAAAAASGEAGEGVAAAAAEASGAASDATGAAVEASAAGDAPLPSSADPSTSASATSASDVDLLLASRFGAAGSPFCDACVTFMEEFYEGWLAFMSHAQVGWEGGRGGAGPQIGRAHV